MSLRNLDVLNLTVCIYMLGLGCGKYCGMAVGLPTFWLVLCCSWRKFVQISTSAQTIIQLSEPTARI
jgi:hypothetical protein